VLVVQSLDETAFPQLPRLAANFAGAEGFLCGDSDTSINILGILSFAIYIEAQATKLFLHLPDFELVLSYQRLQVFA
jgi:hypothetical protein